VRSPQSNNCVSAYCRAHPVSSTGELVQLLLEFFLLIGFGVGLFAYPDGREKLLYIRGAINPWTAPVPFE